jgi:C4-dicarboxylate transporter, DctM subunit
MFTVAVVVYFDPAAAPIGRAYTMGEKLASLRGVGPMVALFVAVTAVIYTGIATPTEASAIGAFGAMVLALWKGQLSVRTLWDSLLRASQTTCMILLIILGAHIFGYFFTITRMTNDIVSWVEALNLAPMLVILVLLLILVILGAFMDQVAILILTVPVFLPLVKALGFDPIWFGVIFVVTAEVGMVTPPMGMNVFVVSRYTGRPVTEVFRGSFPHIIAHIIVIAILTTFPAIILWLPNTM